ncbi:DUF1636 domain-containing protein [Methyloceanibacter sp.]|uniref:DUF1636 domain-containing protein n=1 Tax=Methyloceanibacter sp. TaxID=1965321 RepID=UPI00208788A5|nr:DUF1636 domain-containing protein [Methyloceanibacter sp.]GFO82778.1 MAG: hypothetical protein A49_24050 [Methyloceanibacter sp.]HML91522.1 DUF1636 domain-containing protein [Methyloceanibacter sp.]
MTLNRNSSAKDETRAAGNRPTVYVCVTCRKAGAADENPRPGALLAAAAARAANGTGVTVTGVECLGNCSRSLSAAMRTPKSWTYIFGGLDAASDAPALVEGALLLAGAEDGILPWRGRPEPLKRGLIARIPPLDFTTTGGF